MTPDRLARIVWYGGRPYPVWSHPRGSDDPGTHWHVQTPDGEWHSVLRRRDGDIEGDGWRSVTDAVAAWLENWWAERVDIHDED